MGFFVGVSVQERKSISGILTTVKAHSSTIESLREDHSGEAASINEKAQETFQQRYMVRQGILSPHFLSIQTEKPKHFFDAFRIMSQVGQH